LPVAAGEGVRSALAGRWVSAVMVLLVCWAGAAPGAADALAVTDLVAQEAEFVAAGGNVLIAVNKEAGVPAVACDRLSAGSSAGSGVLASAALTRLEEPAMIATAPGGDLAVYAVTSGVWRLLGVASSPWRELILPASIADRLGVVSGDRLRLAASPGTGGALLPPRPLRVTVADAEILGEEYAGILLPVAPIAGAAADACVVAADPANLAGIRDALPAALPSRAGRTVVLDRLIAGRFTADYSTAYRGRPLAWAWLAAGSLLGMVWSLLLWLRRGADALYATLGARALSRLALRLAEWSALAVLGGLWGVALGMALAVGFGASFGLALPYVARHVGAMLLVSTALVLLGQLRRPRSLLAELKDR